VKGRGINHLRGSGRGDLLVTIQVVTPQKLDAKQKQLLRDFAESRKSDDIKVAKQQQGFFGRNRR
ncbi:MAG: molecular chaperone DnaJ, partial [Actinomycetes bacterium]